MTDMSWTVITEGTADKVRENYKYSKSVPIVGKTGSTQNYADVWFEGYTPDVTLGVWVGYKQPVNTLESKSQRKRAATVVENPERSDRYAKRSVRYGFIQKTVWHRNAHGVCIQWQVANIHD